MFLSFQCNFDLWTMDWTLFNSDCNLLYDFQQSDFLNQSYDYTDWTELQSVQYITITNYIGKIIFKVIYFEQPGSVLIYSK